MKITYQVTKNELGGENIIRIGEDGAMAAIPSDPANSDYAAYLAYVANGNKVPDGTLPSESSIPTTPQAGA